MVGLPLKSYFGIGGAVGTTGRIVVDVGSMFHPHSRIPQSTILMLLLIDGYNLLHSGRTLVHLTPLELQRERERLIDRLSLYRQTKSSEIIVVFDGWQGGWNSEKRERKKGIDLIYSKMGEKADEVIKRVMKERGSGVIVITSDREIARYGDKFSIPVIPSELFSEKLEGLPFEFGKGLQKEVEEEEEKSKKKGPSRQLSKKEKRLRAAIEKL